MIKWYISFRSSELFFYKHWLKRGFSHCDVIKEENGELIMFCCNRKNLNIIKVKLRDLDNCQIVEVNQDLINKSKSMLGLNVFSCVLISKYILGLKTKALTPYQLYKFIIKNR